MSGQSSTWGRLVWLLRSRVRKVRQSPARRPTVEKTGCDGVVIGRGCLDRPWLRRAESLVPGHGNPDLPEARRSRPRTPSPHRAAHPARRPRQGHTRDIRKHMAWYLMGFPVGSELRRGSRR
ncbi:tRNA-dihydrouridine synthase [Amycolatopsis sp. lyj-23]|uniref:tRNA-dihydrouridine synthase n=1 Tax=Amycolatopsis sp. lyj-23 TaxID=2789283 RepID=UPI00397E2494